MANSTNSSNSIIAQLQQKKEPTYLDALNEQQRQSVLHTEGPLLVLAGAGTGKTRVLTTRIAHILASNLAYSNQILAVTFTNKAALEMKERVIGLIGDSAQGMIWLGTFHSIGAKILRRHAELIGLKSNFTILDSDDQIRLLKQLLQAHNIDDKRWPARNLAAIIDSWKNKGLLPEKISSAQAQKFANGLAKDLYQAYQQRLLELNAADFGDLLLLNIKLFQENPDILAIYHNRFKYILVDEYQDSNVAQYLWLRLLAQGKPADKANICVVGDDDQSIYGWRGAQIENILRFEKDFPGAKIIKLEQNYRSSGNILNCAAKIIAHNEGRMKKTIFSASGEMGEKISLTSLWNSEEEARFVADKIEQLQREEEKLKNIAILVRTTAQMREFEEVFIKLGINYRVIGGAKFYERREIRDALAYLRLTYQQTYDLALERIINVPKRGLGASTIEKIHILARAQNISMMQAIRLLLESDELGAKQQNSLRMLVAQFDEWSNRVDTLPPSELAEIILDESGYSAMWQNDKSADAPTRLENLKELVNFMREFETLGEFLEHIALVLERSSNANGDSVFIMTLHGAKGLEFNNIFLPGWEEGLFPSQRSLDENGLKGLEEERRLAYVGITRAKKKLFITLAQNRRVHGLMQNAIPSRFLDELPPESVIINADYSNNDFSYKVEKETQNFSSTKIISTNYSEKYTYSNPKFTVGQQVRHKKFGVGIIQSIEGKKLTIDFNNVGRKKIMDNFIEKI